ncbi:MAG: hypothetical protein ACJ77E_02235 [Gaiellaceae bacterium]
MTDEGRSDATSATTKRDLAIGLTVGGAIFSALLGANALAVSTNSHPVYFADQLIIAFWILTLLLVSVSIYLGVDDRPERKPKAGRENAWQSRLARWRDTRLQAGRLSWLRRAAWACVAIGSLATAAALVIAPLGFARDMDDAQLHLTDRGLKGLRTLCGGRLSAEDVVGKLRTQTLQNEFVVFHFDATAKACASADVDIARADIISFREHPRGR